MNSTRRNAAWAAGAALLSLTAPRAQAQRNAQPDAQSRNPLPSEQMHQQMMRGMERMQSMQLSGDVDRDFALMMRMHHQQAIDMANAQIARGKSPELTALARKIVEDQSKEITQLENWLATHHK